MKGRSLVFLGALLLAVACAETDRESYPAGASGSVEFRNLTRASLYLAGCSHFDYEKQIGDKWVSQGPSVVCVWEGFAQKVASGASVMEPIEAREPGRWRLRYPVGVGCSSTAPLSEAHCRAVGSITSNEFEVLDSGCVVSGCSGQVCADRPYVTTCEWLPEYACYQKARCGRFGPGGTCGWEPTPELLACLGDPARPTW